MTSLRKFTEEEHDWIITLIKKDPLLFLDDIQWRFKTMNDVEKVGFGGVCLADHSSAWIHDEKCGETVQVA